jgi:hypothetical protein
MDRDGHAAGPVLCMDGCSYVGQSGEFRLNHASASASAAGGCGVGKYDDHDNDVCRCSSVYATNYCKTYQCCYFRHHHLSKTFFSILTNSSFLSIPSHHPSFPPFKSATGNGGVSFSFSACFVHPTLLNHVVPEKFRRYATSAFVNPKLPSSSFACSVITLTVIIASRLLPHDAAATVMQVITRSLHALSRVSFSLCRCDVCLLLSFPRC